MSQTRTSQLAWVLCAAALALLAGAFGLALANDLHRSTDWGTKAYPLLVCIPAATFSLVGALIASGRPRHRIGWVCLMLGLGICSQELAGQYGYYGLETHARDLPGARIVAWYAYWGIFPYVGCVFVILLFPTGELLSPRWRVVAVSSAVGILGACVAAALKPGPLAPLDVTNPVGVESAKGFLSTLDAVSTPIIALSAIAAAVSMVLRFRRGQGLERQQIKWFAFVAALLAAIVPFEPVTPLAQDAVTVVFAGLPAAAGIAILRHGLYDIDVVINRTLVYGALTATLAATYLSVVLLLQLVLNPSSDVAVATSTLAVAGLFRPARARIQALVDRRFYRSRYDAARTLEHFGTRVRDQVDLAELEADLRGVVSETVQPVHVSLWLRDP